MSAFRKKQSRRGAESRKRSKKLPKPSKYLENGSQNHQNDHQNQSKIDQKSRLCRGGVFGAFWGGLGRQKGDHIYSLPDPSGTLFGAKTCFGGKKTFGAKQVFGAKNFVIGAKTKFLRQQFFCGCLGQGRTWPSPASDLVLVLGRGRTWPSLASDLVLVPGSFLD